METLQKSVPEILPFFRLPFFQRISRSLMLWIPNTALRIVRFRPSVKGEHVCVRINGVWGDTFLIGIGSPDKFGRCCTAAPRGCPKHATTKYMARGISYRSVWHSMPIDCIANNDSDCYKWSTKKKKKSNLDRWVAPYPNSDLLFLIHWKGTYR